MNKQLFSFFFCLVVEMSVSGYRCPLPMRFSQGSKGGPRGAKPSSTVASVPWKIYHHYDYQIPLITTKLKLWQECVNHIFNPSAFFFFLWTGATWYYHAIYIVLPQFASVTGCEDGTFRLFLICKFKDKNLAEKCTNLAKNL